jgi:DNA-directed RNA polymerase subunit RPC12/RpoP
MSTTIIIAAGAAAILAAIGWMMRTTRKLDEPGMYVYRCPECGQKVRYSARRAGRDALCPQCRGRWVLPATQQPLPPLEAAGRPQQRKRVVGMRKAV